MVGLVAALVASGAWHFCHATAVVRQQQHQLAVVDGVAVSDAVTCLFDEIPP
jgi:hypothetical protein